MNLSRLSLGICFGLLLRATAHAELLAYEGFNYGAGSNLGTLNGGAGWNGGWVNVSGAGSVLNSNLSAGINAPAGYDARSTGNSALITNGSRSGRLLDTSPNSSFGSHGYLNASSRIGADGKSLYLSFLQQASDTVKFFEFELHRGNLGDPGRIGGIGNDFNSTSVNLRAPNSTQTPLGPGSLDVNFYVVRIDFKAGNDDVYVYRNPSGNTEAENEPVLTMLGVADMSFDGISLAAFENGVTVKDDEIRLGETWGDVLGGPPLFAVQPADQNLYVGQTAVFTALAQSRQPISYQWYRGDALLPGQTSSSLTFSSLELSDTGPYSITASNALGVATSSVATLNVQLIGISLPARNLAVGQGSNLVITAAVGGAQPLSLQWFKDGAILPGETNAALSLSNATVFDAGQYFLVASNAYGSVTSSVLTAYADGGAILAYEGFAYAQGADLANQNGGFGWNGPWADIGGGAANILSANLSAGASGPPGYDSHSAGRSVFLPSSSRKGRFLDCSADGGFGLRGYLDDNGNIGADGKALYVSFLQQPDGTTKFYEFEFHRGDLGDPGRIAGVGNDLNSTTVNFRAPSGAQTSLGPGSTTVNFYVLRISFKPGNDDVWVYRNPTGESEAANAPTLTLPGVGDMSFNGISFGVYLNNRTVKHDEVRLGTTWADAVGNSVSQLHMIERVNGQSRIRLAASSNYAYQLQASRVVTGTWTNVARLVMPAVGVKEAVETNVAETQRLYRAAVEPTLPTMTNAGMPNLSRQMGLTNNLLNLPVKNGATMRRLTILVDGTTVRDFDVPLADGKPDWWAFVDVSPFKGKTATLTVNSLSPSSSGLSAIVQSNGIVGTTNLYRETLRPQLHFSSKRGWLNDPNGMAYFQGKYHLYYQHDPYTWHGDHKHWGHAASTDMVHWQELPEAIYPHAYHDDVWSGSVVVDWANTSGFKTGTNDVMVAAFTSIGRGECIAFSNDGGLTFTDYAINPVVIHSGRDPHLLWYAPSNYWVMAVYDATGGDGISFYSSPNLRQWTYRSKINGFFECPDLFQLPVDGQANNLKWVLYDASSGYMIGRFNGAVFTPETAKLPGNEGTGFYAAQTFTEMPPGDSRRIRIGWAMIAMPNMPFNQTMFFPTELTLRTLPAGIRLCSEPVAELTNAVANTYSWTNLTLNPGINPLSGIRGEIFDVRAEFTPGSAQTITLVVRGVPITYSPAAEQITCKGITKALPPVNGSVKLQIITDRQSVEIFGNSGRLYMPIGSTPYSPTNNLVSLTNQGASTVFQSLTVNKLRPMWSTSGL